MTTAGLPLTCNALHYRHFSFSLAVPFVVLFKVIQKQDFTDTQPVICQRWNYSEEKHHPDGRRVEEWSTQHPRAPSRYLWVKHRCWKILEQKWLPACQILCIKLCFTVSVKVCDVRRLELSQSRDYKELPRRLKRRVLYLSIFCWLRTSVPNVSAVYTHKIHTPANSRINYFSVWRWSVHECNLMLSSFEACRHYELAFDDKPAASRVNKTWLQM